MSIFRRLHDMVGLKWRLITGVSALLVVSSLLLSMFLLEEFSQTATYGLQQRGSSLARNLAHNAEFGVMLEISSELDGLIQGMLTEPDLLFVQIFNADGVLLNEGIREGVAKEDIAIGDKRLRMADTLSADNHHVKISELVLPGNTESIEIVANVISHRPEVAKEELGSANITKFSEEQGETIGYVRIALSVEETKAKISETQQMIVYFTLLLVMLGILLSVTLVKMIASPINTLVDATERLASGDLSQRVHVQTDAELERLALAFNTMCDSLEKTQKELELHNQTLEEKVRERTQKLEEVQKQVIQSEKMAAVGQLAAGVAHELNNPLGGILGYAQFALERLAGGKLSEKDTLAFQRYLSDIELQARRCKMIVKNLLKFSRSSDKLEFDLVDVNSALEETFVFTSHQLGMKDIHLVVNLQPNLPHVLGNVNLLQQVFTNILINSMQSMPQGGDLKVTTSFNPPVGEFSGAVEISFTDTGVGIPEENRNKIFEPFFTTKKVGEGTGLGLSVSYGIIRDHGGDIKLESSVGAGSTFTVVLPIVRETARITANV
ncbi:MAG: ATP-binding protein [Candidatus Zixiibacteriota bacterium]